MVEPFISQVTPPATLSEPAHWFIFQGNQLLVQRESGRANVPSVLHPGELGLQPLRTHHLGILPDRHVFSAGCAPISPPPKASPGRGCARSSGSSMTSISRSRD